MTGSFLDAKLVELKGKEVLEAQIVDQLNPQLAALLHLPVGTSYTGDFELTLASLGGRGWVRYGVEGGSLKDCRNVPEPASILMLGASLIGLAAIGFRRAPL